MEYDTARLAEECEEIISQIRPILAGKSGPAIMNSLAFIVAEAMFNVSNPDSWDGNVGHVAHAIDEYLKSFVEEAAKDTQ